MAAFVPRVVQRKTEKKKDTSTPKKGLAADTARRDIQFVDLRAENTALSTSDRETSIDNDANEDGEEVVSFSKNQRWPEPGEPVCVLCGRYGEYICDKTEQDVCSLECKAKHLRCVGYNINNSAELESSESAAQGHDLNDARTEEVVDDAGYLYREHPTIASLSRVQIQSLRDKVEIEVKGENVVSPILEFCHCSFNATLSENLSHHSYHSPTPVQMQTIPVALCGRDVMVCASTGSGKTAAFLLPMITRISHVTAKISKGSDKRHLTHGLVLAPTRELCMQIETQAKELIQGLPNMRTALLIGGLPMPPQLHRIKMGVQIVIATPGRLLEILSREAIDFSHVMSCVVDEVDTMLQLGFEHQVNDIIGQLNNTRQTMLFSATIPAAIETMAAKLLQNPVYISIGTPSTPTQAVKQILLWVEEKSKKSKLFSILKDSKHYNPPVVVFVESKVGADMLAEAVNQVCHIHCMSMHGDKPQNERTQILQSFLAGGCPVIVSTGVLGRGIDLLNIRQVINFDMPSTYEEYVHQVGRAGRLGTRGWAITFINKGNKNIFLQLIENLSPMGVSLPAEITHSVYVQQQRKQSKRNMKRKEMDEIVNTNNLMDLLKNRSTKRKK